MEEKIDENLQKIKKALSDLKSHNKGAHEDLCTMDVDADASWKKVEITVDSGASRCVIDGDAYPGIARTPSAGSMTGQMFLGAGNGETMPNRGQKRFKTRSGKQSNVKNMTFQDVKVRKPLASVAAMNDKGNMVIFDCKESAILPSSAPELVEIRRLLKRVKDRLELEKKGGTFVMALWMQTEDKDEPEGFTGQGR